MAKHVLTQFCLDYANKQPVDEGTIRLLDLIVHFRQLASRLPATRKYAGSSNYSMNGNTLKVNPSIIMDTQAAPS